MMTFLHSRPYCVNLDSSDSTIERPRSSTSCSESRSWFSKALRSRRYHEPSRTSGVVIDVSTKPSPAGCSDQDNETYPALELIEGRSFRIALSLFGLSPIQTMSEEGFFVFPPSTVAGKGPSGLCAATLSFVNSKLIHSVFNLLRSSSASFAFFSGAEAFCFGGARPPSVCCDISS